MRVFVVIVILPPLFQMGVRIVAIQSSGAHPPAPVQIETGFETDSFKRCSYISGKRSSVSRIGLAAVCPRPQWTVRLTSPAEAASVHQIACRAMSAADLVQLIFQQRSADPAGRAKAAALMGKEVREIADDLEQVAALVENHEGTAGGQILEASLRSNSCAGDECSGRTADLHAQRIRCAAIVQDLRDGDAKRIFVDSRCGTSPQMLRILLPADFSVPAAANQAPPCSAIAAAAKVSTLLTTVGLSKIAMGHRIGRAVARHAALAFQRFDQRRFFAADIGARADDGSRYRNRNPADRECSRPADSARAVAASTACNCGSR